MTKYIARGLWLFVLLLFIGRIVEIYQVGSVEAGFASQSDMLVQGLAVLSGLSLLAVVLVVEWDT